MAKTAVIGAGSWGMALALLLHNNGHKVTIWSALEPEIEELKRTRMMKNLPGLILPEAMEFTADLAEAMKEQEVLVIAVPSIYVRPTAEKMIPHCVKGQKIVNVAKGIEESTLMTLSDIIGSLLPEADVSVMSGPSHAEEVSAGLPTTCVVGSCSKETAEYLQSLFMSPAFRVYTSPDILGIEIGGALKNVIALAAGIADGLGYGDNTKAALITRGIHEIARLGTEMGGHLQTFGGLTGIGDLIVTCASMHSRNRRAGILIGKGYTMEAAMKEVKMVVEGVYSAKAGKLLADKYQVPMPIIDEVNAVLFGGKKAEDAVLELMLRNRTDESSDLPWLL